MPKTHNRPFYYDRGPTMTDKPTTQPAPKKGRAWRIPVTREGADKALTILEECAEQSKTPTELMGELGLCRSTLLRNLYMLEHFGLIEATGTPKGGKDRRGSYWMTTILGLVCLDQNHLWDPVKNPTPEGEPQPR